MNSQLFSTLITDGKITPHLALFLKTAFSYSEKSIQATTWVAREYFKGGFIKRWMVERALGKKKLDAITLNREVVFSGMEMYSSNPETSYNEWLELIVHEQFHRHEIEQMGWVYWYFRYGYESLRYGYRNSPSEKRAYAVAMGHKSRMGEFLKSELGKEFVSVCRNETISQKEKNDQILAIAGKIEKR